MSKVRDLLALLNKYSLDDTIAFVIWDKGDVQQAIMELGEQDSPEFKITDEEASKILELVGGDGDDGITYSDIIDAYFDIKEMEEDSVF